MNLIDKAHLLKDIQNTIQTISNKSLPLIDQAKATHHLKDVLTNCKKTILQQEQFTQENYENFQQEVLACIKHSAFKKSYRGVFYEREFLLEGLGENPDQGWAILYDKVSLTWQAWLIPQAYKGAIHCSWKASLKEAYDWLTQQQKLLNCLANDHQDSIQHEKNLVQEAYTVIHLFNQEGVLTHLHIRPNLYRVDFMETSDQQQPYIEWFTQTKNLQRIQENSVIVAEKLNLNSEFIGYMIILGVEEPRVLSSLFSTYCQQFHFNINSVKSITLDQLLKNMDTLENMFECYYKAKIIIPNPNKIEFIPKKLLSSLNLVNFVEATCRKKTPVILLKEQQHYRIVHGKNRLIIGINEKMVPYQIFTREHGISWQKIKETTKTLPSPLEAETLYKVLCNAS